MDRAKVLVAIPIADGVSSEFFRTFFPAQNLLPEEGVAYCEICKWGNIINNRNEITKSFLKTDCTHLFFADSDMSFPEATLSRLLAHDKDIVGGYYTTKLKPYRSTCMMRDENSPEKYQSRNPVQGEFLVKVDALGTGCMLIKRRVLETLKWPWFYYKPNYAVQKFATEDVAFCEDAIAKGFEVWCDFTIRCGHIGHMLVTPYFEDGIARVKLDSV